MKKELVDYKFKLVSKDEYEYVLFIVAKNDLIKNQFIKATSKLKAITKKTEDADELDYENLKGNKYQVPNHMYKLAKLNARVLMEDVKNQVKEDGIKLITQDIKDMYFSNNGKNNDWILEVNVKGFYNDERP